MIGKQSARISYTLCTPYAGAGGILLHRKEKFTIGKLKSSRLSKSFVFNRLSLSISRFNLSYETDLNLSVISFISSLVRCDICVQQVTKFLIIL